MTRGPVPPSLVPLSRRASYIARLERLGIDWQALDREWGVESKHYPGGYDHDQLAHGNRYGAGGGDGEDGERVLIHVGGGGDVRQSSYDEFARVGRFLNNEVGEVNVGGLRRMDDFSGVCDTLRENADWQRAVTALAPYVPRDEWTADDATYQRIDDPQHAPMLDPFDVANVMDVDDDRALAIAISEHLTMQMGDGDRWSAYLQLQANEALGLEDANMRPIQSGIDAAYGGDLAPVFAEAAPGVQAYFRAVYDETQTYLAENGITEVAVFRGMGWDNPHDAGVRLDFDGSTQVTHVAQMPLSSWSADPATAALFVEEGLTRQGTDEPASYEAIVGETVPAERIIGFGQVGLGAPCVHEVVITGAGRDTVNVTSWRTEPPPIDDITLFGPSPTFGGDEYEEPQAPSVAQIIELAVTPQE